MTNFRNSSYSWQLLPILCFHDLRKEWNQQIAFQGNASLPINLSARVRVMTVTNSHSLIRFNDESQAWYRNEMFTTED
jgi:hypothetical protein